MISVLLVTLRDIIRADSDPVHQALFEHWRRKNPVVNAASTVHRVLGGSKAAAALVFLYGVKAYLTMSVPDHAKDNILAIAVHNNAKRQLHIFASWIGSESVVWLRTDALQILRPSTLVRIFAAALRWRSWRRLFRVVDRINRRHDFLTACEAARTLLSYVRALELFEEVRPAAIVVSSDKNPEPLGFARAASTVDIPTVFAAHAYPPPMAPRLRFTLSILEGEAAFDAYRAKGAVQGRVLYRGIEGDSEPLRLHQLLKERPTIGLFAPKTILWPAFIAVIQNCIHRVGADKILIRWHPSMLGGSELPPEVRSLRQVVETDPRRPLNEVARECDWVIAEPHSNVHLGVLKSGVPTVAVSGTSVVTEDLCDLLKNRLIPPPVASLEDLSLPDVVAFYQGQWTERFSRYDAGYLRPQGELVDAIRREVHAILRRVPVSNTAAVLNH